MHMSKKMDTAYTCATCIPTTAPHTPPNLKFLRVQQESTRGLSPSSTPTRFVSRCYLASRDSHTPEPTRTSPWSHPLPVSTPHQRSSTFTASPLLPPPSAQLPGLGTCSPELLHCFPAPLLPPRDRTSSWWDQLRGCGWDSTGRSGSVRAGPCPGHWEGSNGSLLVSGSRCRINSDQDRKDA